jgi:hypothetical protein
MRKVNRQNYLIRPIITVGAVASTILVAACSSSPSSGSSDSDSGGSSAPSYSASEGQSFAASTPASGAADDLDCSDGDAVPVNFTFPDGEIAPGLTACTNSDQSETTIENSANSDIVWVVVQPAGSNPTLDQDFDDNLSLSSMFFRSYLLNSSDSDSTIEPGVQQSFNAAPANVEVQEAPNLQSAWAVSSLLAQATDEGADQVKSALEDNDSPLSDAIFTCVSAGYDFGQQIQNNDQSQQPPADELQSELSSSVGIWESTSDCGEKLNDLDSEGDDDDEAPDLTLHQVQTVTSEVPAWEHAGSDLDEGLAHDVEDFVGHLHP